MSKMKENQKKIEYKKGANPFQTFNKKFHPQHICKGSKSFEPAADGKDIILKGGDVAFEWNADKQRYYTVINQGDWQQGVLYTPYELLTLIAHGGHEHRAQMFVHTEYMNQDFPYILVGNDYYKEVKNTNDSGVTTTELKPRKEKIIKGKYDKRAIDFIFKNLHYEDFTIEPSNTNYQKAVGNDYNLYSKFPHKPHSEPVSSDGIPLTNRFMEQIFGDQIDLGWKYMKVLYERPKEKLPVLCLVSKEKGTGKTTFLNWLNDIFGENYTKIPPEDLNGSFNYSFAYSNIIATDEAFFDKSKTLARIKELSTARKIQVNQKYVSPYSLPFHGKLLMASNNETDFMQIESNSERFWVRKINTIPKNNRVKNFPEKIAAEIPYLLRYLDDHITVDYGNYRQTLNPDEYANEQLVALKKDSRSTLHKDIELRVQEWFYKNPEKDQLYMRLMDFMEYWYENESAVSRPDIKDVLENEMEMQLLDNARYHFYGGSIRKMGAPYEFLKADYSPAISSNPHMKAVDDVPF